MIDKLLPSNGLRLVQTIKEAEFKLPADTHDVLITGVCVRSGEVLLLADYYNRTVKSLRVSTGDVTTVFRESNSDWCVCKAREFNDAVGDLLVVTEKIPSLVQAKVSRVCIARKIAETYNTALTFPLEQTKACKIFNYLADHSLSIYSFGILSNSSIFICHAPS